MRRIDLFIFDLDGTLVDTKQDLTDAINYVRKRLSLPPLDADTVASYIGDGLRRLLERSLPRSQWGRLEDITPLYMRYYQEHALDHAGLFLGVEETLRHFRSKKLVVISNKPERFIRLVVEGLKIAAYFTLLIGGDSMPSMKPNPASILHALRQLEVPRDRAVIVGDGPTDIEAGHHAKILTCAVTYGYRSKAALLLAKPDFIIEDIRKLKELFE